MPQFFKNFKILSFTMALGAHMCPYSYMYCAPHRDGVLHYLTCPDGHYRPAQSSTALQSGPAGNLTQWAFHEVQEHLNRSSDEEVMTFRSWRSHKTKLSHPGSLPYLPGRPFPAASDTHYPPKWYGWKVDSMGFP